MKNVFIISLAIVIITACQQSQKPIEEAKLKILIDTDANNELDDQHALAYAFLNSEFFEVVGVTVNDTRNGDGIQGQYDEALRVIQLFNLENHIPLLKGADKEYAEIVPTLCDTFFNGKPAVDFMIQQALNESSGKLVIVAIGKLTNVALAIKKESKIVDKIRVVWLGSNFPEPGEYNLDNDTSAVNPVIESGVDFEIVTVRSGHSTGTAAVTVNRQEIRQNMEGKGPKSTTKVIGRHGDSFTRFGDYSVNLFEFAEMYGTPPARSLFDMAALAIVKNQNWAEKIEISAPRLQGIEWIMQPENKNKIIIWEKFNRDAILKDLFVLMDNSTY